MRLRYKEPKNKIQIKYKGKFQEPRYKIQIIGRI